MVYQLSLNLLNDHNEALDLSQEVFLRVFRTIHAFRGQSSLRTWIYRIVVNQARNRQRWWRRRHQARSRSRWISTSRTTAICRKRWTAGPTGWWGRSSWRSGSAQALDRLPFDQKTAIVLREIDGLSYDEIGFSLGIAVGTVKSRLGARPRRAPRAIEGRMTGLTCAAVRRRLAAFHDGELPVQKRDRDPGAPERVRRVRSRSCAATEEVASALRLGRGRRARPTTGPACARA